MQCPRVFDDVAVPYFEGLPLLSTRTRQESDFYLDWLADHLRTLPDVIPIPQEALWKKLDAMSPHEAAGCLGDEAFYHFLGYEALERLVLDGKTYDEALAEMERRHEEIYADEDDPDCIEPLNCWINPEMWRETQRELHESRRLPEGAFYVDFGYRSMLAALAAKLDEKDDVIGILDYFFCRFRVEATK